MVFKNYQNSKRVIIQEIYYNFLEKVKLNIPFLDWFHAYTIKNDIKYPFQEEIIDFKTTNVITIWHLKDGEKVQTELPPKTQYQLPNLRDDKGNPVIAAPFKTKDLNEELSSKDTNKYLQVLGEKLISPKTELLKIGSSSGQASTSKQLEKPLFKPFKISQKAKQNLLKAKATSDQNHGELLNKINNLLTTVVPDTPQSTKETSSKLKIRQPTKTIAVLEQSSDNESELNTPSQINPILVTANKQWKSLTKPTTLDLTMEDTSTKTNGFNANNVYEWNIDDKSEHNIMQMLQHMTMVCTAYQTTHDSTEEAIASIIVSGFTGQLKGWWDQYLTETQKSDIFLAVKIDDNGDPIYNNGETIPDAINTLVFTIAQHFIGDPSLWKDRSAKLLSNLRCKTLGDFKWYKDTFLTRIYTREDSQQPFWKEKFLAGLSRSLGDKVREKIRSLTPDNIIPYDHFTYGQLISYVQKTVVTIEIATGRRTKKLKFAKNRVLESPP